MEFLKCVCTNLLWIYSLEQVCISKLKDLQLALVISRLYEGDIKSGSTFYKILSDYVLGESSIPAQQGMSEGKSLYNKIIF